MGTWSCGVNANDTAQDLKSEYQAAFFYNDPETAYAKIDRYVREQICNEDDEEEWCNYFYSLADYMWKKGLLTEEIRDKAVAMIDSGFGLELWRDAGEKTLAKRVAALDKFREQLLSPLPPKKKITISLHTEPVFETGDIIAMQLRTKDKPYTAEASRHKEMTDEEFHALDGKYILIQKIRDEIDYTSVIEPNVKDIWPVFRLFNKIFDEPPAEVDLSELEDACFIDHRVTPLFCTDGGMGRYKKRKCRVIANDKTGIDELAEIRATHVFLSVNNPWSNPDSMFISAIGRELVFSEITDPDESTLKSMALDYNLYYRNLHPRGFTLSDEERERHSMEYFLEILKEEFAAGKKFYEMRFGTRAGYFSVTDNNIENFVVVNTYMWCQPDLYFNRRLLEFAETKCTGVPTLADYAPMNAYFDEKKGEWVKNGNVDWIKILKSLGYSEIGKGREDIIFLKK